MPRGDDRYLDEAALASLDAHWRAANYLAVGQIYLMSNPLLKQPLRPEHINPRLQGHSAAVLTAAAPGAAAAYVPFLAHLLGTSAPFWPDLGIAAVAAKRTAGRPATVSGPALDSVFPTGPAERAVQPRGHGPSASGGSRLARPE